jgi:hypothetical protein
MESTRAIKRSRKLHVVLFAELENLVRDEREIRADNNAHLPPNLLFALPRFLDDVPHHLEIQQRLSALKL